MNLPNDNGVTPFGNCDLCFLKSSKKRLSIIRERPDLARWWIEKEAQARYSRDGTGNRLPTIHPLERHADNSTPKTTALTLEMIRHIPVLFSAD